METSGFLLTITKIALNALMKMSNANIKIHGKENIINQPILYVINHFTRMETFFLPYVIHNITGKDILSLASEDLFVGGFGTYLKKLGALPTNAPDRDRIMIGSLLKDDMPCLIFPEGQMIKDKKLIEKGNYMVYNSGIRRPPHTGASLLALRAEFYREKIRHYRNIKYDEGIETYMKYFNIESSKDIEDILNKETCILPVNLTYYPVRARENIINRIAERFVDKLPERVEEELQVEGTMIIDGVDVDINFGKPITISSYLNQRNIAKKIQNNIFYIVDEEVKKELSFRKEAIKIMYQYMASIYGMTTINHDHIFSYILTKYSRNTIEESDFKNRAYIAIEKIKEKNPEFHHSSLTKPQDSLLTDEYNKRYESFIDAAKDADLINVDNGCIIKNMQMFSRGHQFHTIRKDNIIEVLTNEIEPLKNIVVLLNKFIKTPSFFIRKRIRDEYWKMDNDIFLSDYEKYYSDKESKPKEIGSPYFLRKRRSLRGVLLVHGYLSSPEECRQLADYLYKSGYSVYGVRLRGHGTSPDDLASRSWEEWYESINRGYVVLKNSVKEFAIVGFSTGAGLSLLQSIRKGDMFNSVISINAPLRLNNIASNFASVVVLWNDLLKKIHISPGKIEFVENEPENPNINYFRNPISGVRELDRLMNIVEKQLNRLDIPTLIIQGSNDPVVNPESGLEIFNKAGTEKKEIIRVFSNRHVIVRDEPVEKVFKKVRLFLDDNFNTL
ncbi:MAG: alpha/beta fold hydrolase [Spirochaetota bacterium]|nr:alpha/beta fold hydrolase [Spirochaetota bacterium]